MTSLYEQFLAAGNVKSLQSGQKYAYDRKEQILSEAFEQTAADVSPERLEKVINLLKESKIGKTVFEYAQSTGVQFGFESGLKGNGVYSARRNAVLLNPARKDEALAATLAHECRHVWQDKSQGLGSFATQTPKTYIMLGFAAEADASAIGALFAYEMKDAHPDIWKAHQSEKYAPLSTAIEKTYNETKDINAGLGHAFKAWYSLPVRELYAGDFVDYIDDQSKSFFASSRFQDKIEASHIASQMCQDAQGKCYLSPSVLEAPEQLNITQKQKEKLDTSLTTWAKRFNKKAETIDSDAIYVKTPSGTYSPGKNLGNASKSAAVQQAAKNKRQR